jgi:hypothetical protein
MEKSGTMANYAQDVPMEKAGALGQLQFELERLNDIAGRFEHVLNPVLLPPSPNVSAPTSEPPLQSLARGYVEHLSSLNNRLTELLDRVDL